jgi:hypothetical protein
MPRRDSWGQQPGWRNWQTQRTQNPPIFGSWGFDPPSRHQQSNGFRAIFGLSTPRGQSRLVAVPMAVGFSCFKPWPVGRRSTDRGDLNILLFPRSATSQATTRPEASRMRNSSKSSRLAATCHPNLVEDDSGRTLEAMNLRIRIRGLGIIERTALFPAGSTTQLL